MARRAAYVAAMTVAVLLLPIAVTAAPAARLLATFTIDRSDASNPINAYSWTVPKGVKRVTFDVYGATGGGSNGAGGGETVATYNVTPGQVFQIVVGGAGALRVGGLNGGGDGGYDIAPGYGGGGASDVRTCSEAAFKLCSVYDRLTVAGGGGGRSLNSDAGGSGGGVNGTGGGGLTGGWGGTQTAGGYAFGSAEYGSFGNGGKADDNGGGGGGGWYGGGGGGGYNGGGGGGSGYVAPAISAAMHTGVWTSGDGRVLIYKAP